MYSPMGLPTQITFTGPMAAAADLARLALPEPRMSLLLDVAHVSAPEQREAAVKLAQWVVMQGNQGPGLEETILKKEVANPLFSFLFGGPYHDFYQWLKLNSIVSSKF